MMGDGYGELGRWATRALCVAIVASEVAQAGVQTKTFSFPQVPSNAHNSEDVFLIGSPFPTTFTYEEYQSTMPTLHVEIDVWSRTEDIPRITYFAYPSDMVYEIFNVSTYFPCDDNKKMPADTVCLHGLPVIKKQQNSIVTGNLTDGSKPFRYMGVMGDMGPRMYTVSAMCTSCNTTSSLKVTIGIGFSRGGNIIGRYFLPYDQFPVLYILLVGLFPYIAFIIWYAVLLRRHWNELLTLQKMVMALIVLSFVEGLFIVGDFAYWNNQRWPSIPLMAISTVLITAKKVASRTLFLFVAQGYGVVKPMLPNPKIVGVLGFVYMLAELVDGYYAASDKYEHGTVITARRSLIPVLLMDAVILLLIISALIQTIKVLWVRKANQSEKLKLYLWSLIGFTGFILSNVVVLIMGVLEQQSLAEQTFAKQSAKIRNVEWFKQPLLYFSFLLTLLQMAALWRPTPNNMRYSYIPTSDTMDNDEWGVANEDIKMNSGIFGNLTRRRNKSKKKLPSASKQKRALGENDDASETLKWIEENVPSTGNEVTVAAFVLDDEDIEDMKKEIVHLE